MASKKKFKILLIEDEPLLREICTKKLTNAGFEVATVIDGGEAMDKIKKYMPDLILLDIVLPTLDGYGILKRIRENGDDSIAKIPVLMLSNLGQDTDVDRALKQGANGYLIKAQFTTDEIVDEVKRRLNK